MRVLRRATPSVTEGSSHGLELVNIVLNSPFYIFHSYGCVIIVGYLSQSTDLNRASLVLVVSSEHPEVILIQVPTEQNLLRKEELVVYKAFSWVEVSLHLSLAVKGDETI